MLVWGIDAVRLHRVERLVELVGYASAGGSPVVSVDAWSGGRHLGMLPLGYPRPDLVELPVAAAVLAGYHGVVAVPEATDTVTLTATMRDGVTALLRDIEVVMPGGASGPRQPSGRTLQLGPRGPRGLLGPRGQARGTAIAAVLADLGRGGVQGRTLELLAQLGGVDVLLAGVDGPLLDDARRVAGTVEVLPVRPSPGSGAAAVDAIAATLQQTLSDAGIGTVVVEGLSAFAAVLGAVSAGCTVVWEVHESVPLGEFVVQWLGLDADAVLPLLRRALVEAHHVVVPAAAAARVLGTVRSGPITVLPVVPPLGALGALGPPVPSASAPMALGAFGVVAPHKGQARLAQAFANAHLPHATLTIGGVSDDDAGRCLTAFVERAGAAATIRLSPWIDRMDQELGAVDVAVSASTADTLPGTVLEAMAAARPVLGTEVGAVPELIRQGREGWLAAAGHIGALEGGLRRAAATDAATRSRMGIWARERLTLLGPHSRRQEQMARLLGR